MLFLLFVLGADHVLALIDVNLHESLKRVDLLLGTVTIATCVVLLLPHDQNGWEQHFIIKVLLLEMQFSLVDHHCSLVVVVCILVQDDL